MINPEIDMQNETQRMSLIEEQNVRHILDTLLKAHNMSEIELSRQCKLSQPAIHKILSGATPDPRLSSLKMLAKFFNISLSQLVGEEPLPKLTDKTRGILIKIPLITWEQAFEWQKIIGNYIPSNWTYWTTVNVLKPSQNSFALTIDEYNAVDSFSPNSVIIVDPDCKPHTGNYAVIYRYADQAVTIKELQFEGQDLWLIPLNKKIAATRYDKNCKICGVILQKNVPLVMRELL